MSDVPTAPPALPYRYEFEPGEIDAIKACHDDHGFAVVKGFIDADYVEELKASIRAVLDPEHNLGPGETRLSLNFIEHSQPMAKLLDYQPYLKLYHRLVGTDQLTLHRTAAIMKNVGAGPVSWHTDHSFEADPPRNSNDVLNRGDWPNGKWFYLNGTRPHRGGLAVIADSHRPDWEGPEGFAFTEGKKSFYRKGEEPRWYDKFDVPGVVPLFTDPGDMIVFACRTYHAAFPHNGDEPRLSCAAGFRPGRKPYPCPWDRPESTQEFVRSLPDHLQPYVEHYTGIVQGWSPAS